MSEYTKHYTTLVVGYGNIGKFVESTLKTYYSCDIYDKYIPEYNQLKDTVYDIAFICVPTDTCNGVVDTSNVEEAIKLIQANIIVIKSTVPVGFCDTMTQQGYTNIVYSPEYWGTTLHANLEESFIILAGDKEYTQQVATYYYRCKEPAFKIHFTDYKTAELAKYMENCFLALKVTFCCEFSDIAKQFDVSYPELRELFILDKRMGESHTHVYPEQPYYDSHCLNKDIPGLLSFTSAPLMEAVNAININKKLQYKHI